jgi:hypothetical protein
MTELARAFELGRQGFNLRGEASASGNLLVPRIVPGGLRRSVTAIPQRRYRRSRDTRVTGSRSQTLGRAGRLGV